MPAVVWLLLHRGVRRTDCADPECTYLRGITICSHYFSVFVRVSTTYGNDALPVRQKRIHFSPKREPGVHLTEDVGVALRSTTKRFLTALDFFFLFFSADVIETVCENTNKYAYTKILEKPTHARPDGSWEEVTTSEMRKFIGLIIYMGILKAPRIKLYWNVGSIYSGLLPPRIMPRRRFIALLAMLHVADLDDVTQMSKGKLRFVWWLLQHMNKVSAKLFQPHRDLSVDERMVKSKARSGIRQYIKDKVTKWGYKLWVLADPLTGYTVQFAVYTGKREQPGPHGLAFDVVCQLCAEHFDQGYKIFMDNFYTSTHLFSHLLDRKTLACGTTRKDRRGFPVELKDTRWEKKAQRGEIRWLRDEEILYLQWKDRRVVNMMSTMHTANETVTAKRRQRSGSTWTQISVPKPLLIHEYNSGMIGVDKSDQMIGYYNVLMRSVRWWKTLFFHCIDIACVNSFILFQEYRKLHPDVPELARNASFDHLAFREELVQQLLHLEGAKQTRAPPPPPAKAPLHKPQKVERRKNCKLCYQQTKNEVKTTVFCSDCNAHLCFNASRNCFLEWHREGAQK
ncbi:piggyBac transposable element-derived protein 4-like [Dermacentor albipictus]|uniref:piggyBac transposable element-derived protein 4-like n=1 Tax=Dermacentor albipictus TaxID=60249 RepID=UPI0038FC6F98